MQDIQGLSVLYSEYYSRLGVRIFFWVVLVASILLIGYTIYTMIKDKDYDCWFIVIMLMACLAIVCAWLYMNSHPYTEYYVTIDRTAKYLEIQETFGEENINHQGGEVYKITITDYDK